jgi:hypothetical protein
LTDRRRHIVTAYIRHGGAWCRHPRLRWYQQEKPWMARSRRAKMPEAAVDQRLRRSV